VSSGSNGFGMLVQASLPTPCFIELIICRYSQDYSMFNSRSKIKPLVWLIGLLLASSQIQNVLCEDTATIAGKVTYSGKNMEGIQVDLLREDWYSEPINSTITDETGFYIFTNLPLGEYLVKAIGPSNQYHEWIGYSTNLTAKGLVREISLYKSINFTYPENLILIEELPIDFKWEPIAEASSYLFIIRDAETRERVYEEEITESEYLLRYQLEGDKDYTWHVIGYNEDHNYIADEKQVYGFYTIPNIRTVKFFPEDIVGVWDLANSTPDGLSRIVCYEKEGGYAIRLWESINSDQKSLGEKIYDVQNVPFKINWGSENTTREYEITLYDFSIMTINETITILKDQTSTSFNYTFEKTDLDIEQFKIVPKEDIPEASEIIVETGPTEEEEESTEESSESDVTPSGRSNGIPGFSIYSVSIAIFIVAKRLRRNKLPSCL